MTRAGRITRRPVGDNAFPWDWVDRTGECWIWTRASSGGYGTIRDKATGKNKKAHRMAYEDAVGKVPDGMEIMHSCDNPSCVKPAHLTPGTHLENMGDAASRGLIKRRHPGSSNHKAKLSESDVMDIRTLFGVTKAQALADAFSVGRDTIYDIVNRQTWRHVP